MWFLWNEFPPISSRRFRSRCERAEPISIIITGAPGQHLIPPFFHFHQHLIITINIYFAFALVTRYGCAQWYCEGFELVGGKSVSGPPLSCGEHLSGFDDHHLGVVSKTSSTSTPICGPTTWEGLQWWWARFNDHCPRPPCSSFLSGPHCTG